MGWIVDKLPSMLAGLGIILLLALLTRGNLKGRKAESKGGDGGCAGCSCQGGCEHKTEKTADE